MNSDPCKQIRAWLAHCQIKEPSYDQGGIFDPLDQQVIGDHYATTHFAWACALSLYESAGGPDIFSSSVVGAPGSESRTTRGGYTAGPDTQWLESARNAIAFHIRTSPDEYPPGSWDYHWDFNNLAFVETYGLLADHLSIDERRLWQQHLLQWKTNSHSAVNWVAMRALELYRRGTLLNRPEDIKSARKFLAQVLAAQTADGCFDDLPGISRPSQYHAYTACLLLRMKEMDTARITPACIKATRWLLAVCAPDGDMNSLGRGQGQIFGYVCALYLFRAAKTLDPTLAPQCQWAETKILERLTQFLDPRGFFPLVLNDCPVETRCGWYDYHHLTVYNAFALVWLYLARTELDTVSGGGGHDAVPLPGPLPPDQGIAILPHSGIFSARSLKFSLVCTAGTSGAGYATDVGISPHFLFFRNQPLFRYPIGPGPGKYGTGTEEQHQMENIWAPLVHVRGQWIAPFGGKGAVAPLGPNGCRMTYCRDHIIWKRDIIITSCFLEIRDSLDLSATSLPVDCVRTVNVALKRGVVTDRTARRLVMDGPGLVLSAWSDGADLVHRGTVQAADGIVDIFAMEMVCGNQRRFQSGCRVRPLPSSPGGRVPSIVCFTWDPWSELWKRKQRLLYDISNDPHGPSVIYAEPPLSLTTVVEDPRSLIKTSPGGNQYRRALSGRLVSMGKRFSLYTPLYPLPGARTIQGIHRINQCVAGYRFKKIVHRAGCSRYVLWLYHPSQLWLLDCLGDRADLIVYDWTDDWVAAFPDHLPVAQKAVLAEQQQTLLRRCDLVFGVSRELCRRAEKYCSAVFYLPNATDPGVFKPVPGDQSLHPVLAHISVPRLVYLSQITERLDVDLLAGLASRQPEWQILFIGPVVCSYDLLSNLRDLKNVHFIGRLPYQEAARVVAQADVSILPHRVDELTHTLDPIKLYDYLAVGNPVVSTPVAMHPDLKPHIAIATTCDGFESAVQAALAEPAQAAVDRRKAALGHVWERRKEEALEILSRFFYDDAHWN